MELNREGSGPTREQAGRPLHAYPLYFYLFLPVISGSSARVRGISKGADEYTAAVSADGENLDDVS